MTRVLKSTFLAAAPLPLSFPDRLMDAIPTFPPTTISEPWCLLLRRGAFFVGLQRTLRLSIIFIVLLLAFEAAASRWHPDVGRMPTVLFLFAPLMAAVIASLPRTVHLSADSIAVTKNFDKREYSVTGDQKPILLMRPIPGGKHHLALISPTVSDRLFEIAPVFECIVANSDVPSIRYWCDYDPEKKTGEQSDAPESASNDVSTMEDQPRGPGDR